MELYLHPEPSSNKISLFLTFIFVGVGLILEFKSTKIKNLLISLLMYMFLLVFFTILFWPILWEGPVYHFVQAFNEMRRYPWNHPILYLGNYIKSTVLPFHYIPVWLIITTPIFYTFNFFIGLFATIKSLLKRPMFYSNHQKRNDLIFLLWFFIPLVAVISLKSVLYDGWRHMYFIYPAFLLISLKGLLSLFEFIKLRFRGQAYRTINVILILIVNR